MRGIDQCIALYCMGLSVAVVIWSLEVCSWEVTMYSKNLWCRSLDPLLGSGPLLGGSVIGGSTVFTFVDQYFLYICSQQLNVGHFYSTVFLFYMEFYLTNILLTAFSSLKQFACCCLMQ